MITSRHQRPHVLEYHIPPKHQARISPTMPAHEEVGTSEFRADSFQLIEQETPCPTTHLPQTPAPTPSSRRFFLSCPVLPLKFDTCSFPARLERHTVDQSLEKMNLTPPQNKLHVDKKVLRASYQLSEGGFCHTCKTSKFSPLNASYTTI